MKRRGLLIWMAFLICMVFAAPGFAAPTVYLDGKQLSFDVQPTIENGRTLVPLRAIFEAMGATVDWNQSTQTATAIKDGTTVKLTIGSLTPTINGQVKPLDVPAKIVNGRTLAPLRFVGEAFGGTVIWDPATQKITISTGAATAVQGKLEVHFIDVGQADSILIELPNGQSMLVDAGNNSDGQSVVSYIKSQGINRIDYLIGTHPHEDHIGGLDTVINSFSIGKIYMPKVSHTTKTYEDVLLAVQTKGLKITPARAGESIINTGNLKAEILAPVGSSYDDLNDWSAVIKIQYGQKSFLLTGDAEEYSEAEMLRASKNKLKSTVLKVGHHGSNSSTSPAFLQAVDPDYAVISVGQGNDYGHPHKETLQKLAGVEVYRTDLNGTIVFETDGQTITIQKQRNTIEPRAPDTTMPVTQGIYIGNKNSKIFHKETCSTLPAAKNQVLFKTWDEAITQGYRPCQRCNP